MTVSNNDEFVALEHFNRIVHWWWVILATAILGAAVGYAIHRAMPPIYEAQAVFTANLDLNKVDFMHPPAPTPAPYELTQYDEDMSLAIVQASLIAVIPQVETFARQNNIPLTEADLLNQKIVNFWAQAGYQDLLARQKAGQVPSYVFFDLIQLADLPTSPTYFQTNVFVLAGCLIGIVLGVVITSLRSKPIRNQKDG